MRHDHRMDVRAYLARERALGAGAWELAAAAPECAMVVFGRDVRSEDDLEACRVFVERERERAGTIRARMEEWDRTPADEVAGPDAAERVRTLYELHLPLKRWVWREGLLDAAGHSAG